MNKNEIPTIDLPKDKKLLLLSDMHLGGFTEDENELIEADLLHVIEWARSEKFILIIAGDLFDYWMEYPNNEYPTEFSKIVKEIALYPFPKYFITGNHDNWDRGLFSELFSFCHGEMIRFRQLKELLVFHGDGFKDQTWGFRRKFYHRILRSEWFVKIYQTIFSANSD